MPKVRRPSVVDGIDDDEPPAASVGRESHQARQVRCVRSPPPRPPQEILLAASLSRCSATEPRGTGNSCLHLPAPMVATITSG